MKTIVNLLWLIFGGFLMAISYLFAGVLLCLTIIGIPFGKQCFKYAKLYLWPSGKKVDLKFLSHPIINTIWLILFGWELFIGHIIVGLIYCISIIGIPFGLQWFKLAKLSLCPFGAKVK